MARRLKDTFTDFNSRLLAGELLIGTMLTFPSPEIAEMMGLVGFDWLFVDGVHSALAARKIQALSA